MDVEARSQLVGAYLRSLVSRSTERVLHAVAFGVGKPVINPFTQERMATRAPEEAGRFATLLAERKLNQDPEFMGLLADCIAQAADQPIRDILSDLANYEARGDGGPDPAFRLAFEDGQTVQPLAVEKGYGAADIAEMRNRVCIGWPRNASGRAACACCGYFTFVDAPASEEICPVCRWEDYGDLTDPWNMAKWGIIQPPPLGQPDPFGYRDMAQTAIDHARRNYKRFGAYEAKYAELARGPTAEEQPRYDWSKDRRPCWPKRKWI